MKTHPKRWVFSFPDTLFATASMLHGAEPGHSGSQGLHATGDASIHTMPQIREELDADGRTERLHRLGGHQAVARIDHRRSEEHTSELQSQR